MSHRPVLVAATANEGKLREIRAILGDAVTLLPRPATVGEVIEDADTLAGNARLKAAAICAATGQAALADDTGLEVDALGGAPGVHSARYAGEDADPARNVAKLLAELEGVEAAQRSARFRTVVIVVRPDGSEVLTNGVVEGRIADGARGGRGFGYDPVFVPDGGGGRTFAEMSEEEKNALSHRGRALRALLEQLRTE